MDDTKIMNKALGGDPDRESRERFVDAQRANGIELGSAPDVEADGPRPAAQAHVGRPAPEAPVATADVADVADVATAAFDLTCPFTSSPCHTGCVAFRAYEPRRPELDYNGSAHDMAARSKPGVHGRCELIGVRIGREG